MRFDDETSYVICMTLCALARSVPGPGRTASGSCPRDHGERQEVGGGVAWEEKGAPAGWQEPHAGWADGQEDRELRSLSGRLRRDTGRDYAAFGSLTAFPGGFGVAVFRRGLCSVLGGELLPDLGGDGRHIDLIEVGGFAGRLAGLVRRGCIIRRTDDHSVLLHTFSLSALSYSSEFRFWLKVLRR